MLMWLLGTHPSLEIGVGSLFHEKGADILVAVVRCYVEWGESALKHKTQSG